MVPPPRPVHPLQWSEGDKNGLRPNSLLVSESGSTSLVMQLWSAGRSEGARREARASEPTGAPPGWTDSGREQRTFGTELTQDRKQGASHHSLAPAGPRRHPSPPHHLCGFLSLVVSGSVFDPAQIHSFPISFCRALIE